MSNPLGEITRSPESDPHVVAIKRHLRKMHVTQLPHADVAPILKRYGYKLPANVDKRNVARWHLGYYYGYGAKDLWIPLNSMGGMANAAFHEHTVKFPKRIDTALRKLLEKAHE